MSHARKHVLRSVLNSYPEPTENEFVVQVIQVNGDNIVEVCVPSEYAYLATKDSKKVESKMSNKNKQTITNEEEQESQTETLSSILVLLPRKFNKLIWIKRGDFLIVEGCNKETLKTLGKNDKIRGMITHVLYQNQISHLIAINKFPECFIHPKNKKKKSDSILSEEEDDDELFQNPNRNNLVWESESSSSSSTETETETESESESESDI
ncbi:translation initiation factor-related [Anaeramoeba flamelloides]|uniref:Translation initiation factor-related n=1 Tax=Anaeramoeba flamelloides TaxID=1746091 RepID=A0ABQ8YG97_9EUKA|nr:translation initiation factor-related [Anaeramoeba flamelloides]